eukprot:4115978-Prymnesium_polylepis.3
MGAGWLRSRRGAHAARTWFRAEAVGMRLCGVWSVEMVSLWSIHDAVSIQTDFKLGLRAEGLSAAAGYTWWARGRSHP